MRLLTHNFLQCHKKGVANGFPLIIKPKKVKVEESPYNKAFVVSMIPKLQYDALVQALTWIREISHPPELTGPDSEMPEFPELPAALPMDYETDEDFLQRLHRVINDIHLVDGALVCPVSGREFPVEDRIPNMLLNEDEV